MGIYMYIYFCLSLLNLNSLILHYATQHIIFADFFLSILGQDTPPWKLLNRIPGQLLRTCEPASQVICDSRRQENPRPSPSPPLPLQCSGDPGGFPGFPDSTSPGPASAPIGQSGPHTANQNGGGLNSYIHTYDTTTMRPARQVICDSPTPDFFTF